MTIPQNSWLEQILTANQQFKQRITPEKLPVGRSPGQVVITCMDPRVNLEAIGIPQFAEDGTGTSSTRVIRTLGAVAENRSLIVGIFLAGFKEITVVMHTDCGCCLAYDKVDVISQKMQAQLSAEQVAAFKAEIGEPFEDNLRSYLKAFQDPHDAVKQEVAAIRQLAFVPEDVAIHGLVYELETGQVELVVNGYA